MKTNLCIILTVLLVFCISAVPEVYPVLSLPTQYIEPGKEIIVPVKFVSNGIDLYGMNIKLQYDTGELEFIRYSGDLVTFGRKEENNNHETIILYVWYPPGKALQDGYIIELTFKIPIGKQGSELKFTNNSTFLLQDGSEYEGQFLDGYIYSESLETVTQIGLLDFRAESKINWALPLASGILFIIFLAIKELRKGVIYERQHKTKTKDTRC